MPRSDLILVLDGEMTGNTDDDELIEIGVVALSTSDLEEVSYFQGIIKPTSSAFARMIEHPVVGPMLTKNGLVDDLVKGGSPENIDEELINWLKGLTPSKYKTTHIPYGGSGAEHFDRKYIDKALPRFGKRITHWSYDVGSSRRMYALADVPWALGVHESKTHRALDDARVHADELRYVVKTLRQWHRGNQKYAVRELSRLGNEEVTVGLG